MPTICPKCRTVRPANAVVPDWQCPACGVAYAKAGDSGATLLDRRRSALASASSRGDSWFSNVPWGKLIAGLVIVYGAWLGFNRTGAVNGASPQSSLSAQQLAAKVN